MKRGVNCMFEWFLVFVIFNFIIVSLLSKINKNLKKLINKWEDE